MSPDLFGGASEADEVLIARVAAYGASGASLKYAGFVERRLLLMNVVLHDYVPKSQE